MVLNTVNLFFITKKKMSSLRVCFKRLPGDMLKTFPKGLRPVDVFDIKKNVLPVSLVRPITINYGLAMLFQPLQRMFSSSPLIENQEYQHERPEKKGLIHNHVPQTSDILSKALVETNQQKELYSSLIDAFPDGLQMVFAYGSGAIPQKSNSQMSQNMLDFIFVVDKPRKWHRLNLERHPHHYSFLRRFGPRFIKKIQDGYGAGVYFNTLVPMQGRLIKYGVISTARLITDLLDWETLYVSGRLHKPVSMIVVPTDEELIKALLVNIESAVHSALLLLPDMFTEEQFYMTIAGLSYAGDIRMSLAEDNNKIKNIVSPNMMMFRQLYLPVITNQEHVTFWPAEGQLEQALTFHSRHHHMTRLPCHVLHGLLMQKYQVGVFPDLEEIIHLHAHDSECGTHISRSIRQIVKKSSTTQSLKGLLTAGFLKSIRYSMSKVLKKLRSR